jgi:hypothetical protein
MKVRYIWAGFAATALVVLSVGFLTLRGRAAVVKVKPFPNFEIVVREVGPMGVDRYRYTQLAESTWTFEILEQHAPPEENGNIGPSVGTIYSYSNEGGRETIRQGSNALGSKESVLTTIRNDEASQVLNEWLTPYYIDKLRSDQQGTFADQEKLLASPKEVSWSQDDLAEITTNVSKELCSPPVSVQNGCKEGSIGLQKVLYSKSLNLMIQREYLVDGKVLGGTYIESFKLLR